MQTNGFSQCKNKTSKKKGKNSKPATFPQYPKAFIQYSLCPPPIYFINWLKRRAGLHGKPPPQKKVKKEQNSRFDLKGTCKTNRKRAFRESKQLFQLSQATHYTLDCRPDSFCKAIITPQRKEPRGQPPIERKPKEWIYPRLLSAHITHLQYLPNALPEGVVRSCLRTYTSLHRNKGTKRRQNPRKDNFINNVILWHYVQDPHMANIMHAVVAICICLMQKLLFMIWQSYMQKAYIIT